MVGRQRQSEVLHDLVWLSAWVDCTGADTDPPWDSAQLNVIDELRAVCIVLRRSDSQDELVNGGTGDDLVAQQRYVGDPSNVDGRVGIVGAALSVADAVGEAVGAGVVEIRCVEHGIARKQIGVLAIDDRDGPVLRSPDLGDRQLVAVAVGVVGEHLERDTLADLRRIG